MSAPSNQPGHQGQQPAGYPPPPGYSSPAPAGQPYPQQQPYPSQHGFPNQPPHPGFAPQQQPHPGVPGYGQHPGGFGHPYGGPPNKKSPLIWFLIGGGLLVLAGIVTLILVLTSDDSDSSSQPAASTNNSVSSSETSAGNNVSMKSAKDLADAYTAAVSTRDFDKVKSLSCSADHSAVEEIQRRLDPQNILNSIQADAAKLPEAQRPESLAELSADDINVSFTVLKLADYGSSRSIATMRLKINGVPEEIREAINLNVSSDNGQLFMEKTNDTWLACGNKA